ncbi:hypothetical protein HG531_013699 [Fusarium graminearum]|nr:hypothetical protein HG531_013699 [Fusarium graminearum]
MSNSASRLLGPLSDVELAQLAREPVLESPQALDKYGVPYGSVWWRFSKFFEVTLAWGSLDFTTAKLIDVTWDLVVGRGGQATMSFIAWKRRTRRYGFYDSTRKPLCYLRCDSYFNSFVGA